MFSLLLLLQISFNSKNEIKDVLKNNEAYQFHKRINDDQSQISLNKVIFSNFQNYNFNGGAIYIKKNHFNCSLSNCKFVNCIGKLGGAIYLKSIGHQNPHSCSIYNALFTNCRATNGGALYLTVEQAQRNSITIEGCTFKNNFVSENGGAIYGFSREKLAIQRCRFENNEAKIKGSSIWCLVGEENRSINQKLVLYRNSFVFTANENNLINVYIQSSHLNNITKPNANIYLGLCSFKSLNITFKKYKNLEVVEEGKFESFNLTDCNCIQGDTKTVSIKINTTTNYSNYLIFNCKNIDQCQSQWVVNPVPPITEDCVEYPNRIDYIGGSGIELGKACFNNFRSPIQQDGGAIHVINAQIDLEKCHFYNCSTDCNGGAIFAIIVIFDCEIEIEDCIFDSCQSYEDGGAVYVYMCEDFCEMEVDNTIFINCSSYHNGGAFFVSFDGNNCNLEFEDTSFDSCKALNEGGALYFLNHRSSRSTFETCNFTNNKASNAGAFYYSPYSYSKLCRCEFTNNTCSDKNCSSSVYVYINPNQKNFILESRSEDNETEIGNGEDHNDNIYGDIPDNLTFNNVVISENVFSSDPIEESAQLVINMKKNAHVLLGKNSFSFNNKDFAAEEINSNYINIYKENDSNLTFKDNEYLCFAGNSSLSFGVNKIQTNCKIVHVTLDLDDDYKISVKTEKKKNKIVLTCGIVFGCVASISIIVLIILVIIPKIRNNELRQYSRKINSAGESVVNNTDNDINDDLHIHV